ncbi:MAG: MFS transporter [Steroidobacteraceae bacterium]
MEHNKDKQYQRRLTWILSITFGIVLFDRNAANFLAPLIAVDFHLNYTQVGILSSGLALTWAISGMAGGVISDRIGRRKLPLLICVTLFSLCSVLSGMAYSFGTLLASRLLMGVAEGPILPISHSMIAEQSSLEERGHNMGVMQNAGSALLGSFVAPIVLVPIAQAVSWHGALYLAALPGIVMAVVVWRGVREPKSEPSPLPSTSKGARISIGQLLQYRNFVLCLAATVALVAFVIIGWVFLPQYYTQTLGFSPGTMSRMMGLLGLSSAAFAFVVPRLSDRFGRRPVIVAACFMGLFVPVSLLTLRGPPVLLGCLVFLGASVAGAMPLLMGTVPSETVPPRMHATAIAMVMGVGEIFGGVLGPTLSGMAADRWGLTAPLWIVAACTISAGLLALGLVETAPRIVNRNLGRLVASSSALP